MSSKYFLILPFFCFGLARAVPDDLPAKPNILIAIADDQSWPHTGAYGTTWVSTPGFDRIAREGLLFNNAYTPNAKCAPSRACILTGRNSWQLEEAANHLAYFPTKFPTWMEALKQKAGYFIGFTTKGWAPGIATNADGSTRWLTGARYNKRKVKPPTSGITSSDYAGNFEDFLSDATSSEKPWAFWYGSVEPHRRYEFGSGLAKGGKKLSDIEKVPGFWPDNDTIRNDMLDYAFEIEHFDRHLVRMIKLLEKSGQLENTIIIVTADNGMPFPRIKGQEYELSNHLPLAIMWKAGINKPGRKIDDFVSFIDFAPTLLQAAKLAPENSTMASLTGRSLFDIFESEKSGQINPARDHVLIGKERHDVGRPHDWGFPIRGIVTKDWLYIKNFEPTRWPAGDPITGYLNCDGSPTKTWILDARRDGSNTQYWQESFGKRPAEEFYQLSKDRECLRNLANDPTLAKQRKRLTEQMKSELIQQEDPRMQGKGSIFDQYRPTSGAGFYDLFKAGKPPKSGWVNPGDFEKETLE